MHLDYCPEAKIVPAVEAIGRIRNGSRLFLGSGCGEPRHLIHALIADQRLQDIMLYQMLSLTLGEYLQDEDFFRRFSLKLFFVSPRLRQAALEGKIDVIPSYVSEFPGMLRSNQIGLDAALIQVSPPDRFGFVSLGVSVDVTREAVRSAGCVIAQVNPRMPRTNGNTFIHIDQIHWLVPWEEPLMEHVPQAADEETLRRIAHYVSELVDDGSTLQVGYGFLPYTVLAQLGGKRDLGIHTHMISDAFIPLFKQGVITNRRKNFMTDRAVASFCMGTRATYDYIDDNPGFFFGTADFVNDPGVVAQNDNFVSISSALQVDLTGQVCSDLVGRHFFSGTADQTNFIRGAALSKGGFSIIALPSTTPDGKSSTIVASLDAGAGLAALRADIHFVVTEHGIAQLKGKSIYQRAVELAQIAHPAFRAELIAAAKGNCCILQDQLPPPAMDLLFLEDYKSRLHLADGRAVSIRPLLPSDEIAYRNFFYSLREETVYLRFFQNIQVFSHKMAQQHWSALDYRRNLTLIGLVRRKANQEIMAIATYAAVEAHFAEVAFVVREDFQGRGITSAMLERLERIARQNGFTGFRASVLASNAPMLRVLRKRYPSLRGTVEREEIALEMDFASPEASPP
jgi:acyl-CoA hydrolase